MRTIILTLLTCVFSLALFAQEKTKRLPFVLLIDNDVPNPSYIQGRFVIGDSLGFKKDSISFDYEIGGLNMSPSDYDRLFNIKQVYKVFLKITLKSLVTNADQIYEVQIPNKYQNEEYPNGFINKAYFILKIFNRNNAENNEKYYFKKNENYISQLIIPGESQIIVLRKKK